MPALLLVWALALDSRGAEADDEEGGAPAREDATAGLEGAGGFALAGGPAQSDSGLPQPPENGGHASAEDPTRLPAESRPTITEPAPPSEADKGAPTPPPAPHAPAAFPRSDVLEGCPGSGQRAGLAPFAFD